jgi:hypothetical protein
MEVGPSRVNGAGQGLFATVDIPRGKIFRFRKFAPRDNPRCGSKRGRRDVLEFYVRRQADPATPCVADGRVVKLRDVYMCPNVFRRRYVCVQRNSPVMKANDLAWAPGIDRDTYEQRAARKNKMELILDFGTASASTSGPTTCRNVIDVCAYVNKSIKAGEEIGITYGHHYWS